MAVTHFPERHYEGMLFEAFLDLSNKHGPKKGWRSCSTSRMSRLRSDPRWGAIGHSKVQVISCRSLIADTTIFPGRNFGNSILPRHSPRPDIPFMSIRNRGPGDSDCGRMNCPSSVNGSSRYPNRSAFDILRFLARYSAVQTTLDPFLPPTGRLWKPQT